MDLKIIAQSLNLPEDATEEQILSAIDQSKSAPGYIDSYDKTKIKVSEAEFDSLKARYKHLYVLDVVIDPTESYQFITRRPSRELIEAIAEKKGLGESNDLLIKNMIVAGDTDALDDGIVYSAVMKSLGRIVRQAQAFLGKA